MMAKRDPKEWLAQPPKPLGNVKAWVEDLIGEGVIGMWKNREDMVDSSQFSSRLRQHEEKRSRS